MSGRFSFDNDDENSFAPRHANSIPQQQYHSARGPDYDVPPPPQHASLSDAYHDDHSSNARNLIDSSPTRNSQPPLEHAQRGFSDTPVPVPPPHRRMSSDDSHSRGGYGVAGGAAADFGAGAGMDTAYHGGGHYQDYQSYNPFEHAEPSHMQPPAHNYPEYPHNTLDDPFASRNTSYNNLAPPDSYEMQQRPGPGQRPSSFASPYGSYDHAASEGDLGHFDPRDIADEDDDTGALAAQRKSRGPAAAGAGGAAAGAGAFVAGMASRDASGKYNAVPGGDGGEKGTTIVGKASKGKRTMWVVGAVIALVVILAIVGGAVGGYIYSHKGGSSSSDSTTGGDYDKNSAEVKKLLNNPDLHKVFPGIDYTPYGAQYPDCLSYMPSQNNVTMDVAVLSQLTPQIRLYGTDCNQTEMTLNAIDKLGLQKDVKVWLGVYLDGNQTTNDRQLAQMWSILEDKGSDTFQGVIVGNEVLFSQYMPEAKLTGIIDDVRKNLTVKNYNLPVATSDLGRSWTDSSLAQHVDWVMANVHPFFGGVTIDQAASWTYTYWQQNDVAPTNKYPNKKQMIAETGWPSGGGNYCTDEQGSETPCKSPTDGAVAGVDNMNKFMDDWVCQALANGTQYFMFEAFDEPWKAKFNKPGQDVEDKWGLMDPARNLKPGLKIPDCGGKTASLPS